MTESATEEKLCWGRKKKQEYGKRPEIFTGRIVRGGNGKCASPPTGNFT